jgi:uncharacterized protein YeaO (DUF488 family)
VPTRRRPDRTASASWWTGYGHAAPPRRRILIDDWVKDAAPGAALRKWFNHEPPKWNEFKRRYFRELDGRPDALKRLLAKSRAGTMTLVFGARDAGHNNAVALKEYPERHAGA